MDNQREFLSPMEPSTTEEIDAVSGAAQGTGRPIPPAGDPEDIDTHTARSTLTLAREAATYESHHAAFLAAHPGEFVVIRDETILGVFDSRPAALAAGFGAYGIVPFLVRQIQCDEPAASFSRDV